MSTTASPKQGNISSPTKWHGGKGYLAKKIVALFPSKCKNPNAPAKDDGGYLHYCEPFFGGGSVLFAADPADTSECVNDLNFDLTVFWRVLASDAHFPEFLRRAQATPFSEAEWSRETESEDVHGTATPVVSAVETAFRFFVRCRQSMAGRMDSFAPLSRNRTRSGMNEQASAWLSAIDRLPEVHARLKRVVVLGPKDGAEVIRQQDGPRTLFYLDPPYVHVTRASKDVYNEEMSDDQHATLLSLLSTIEGRFLLSAYDSPLYNEFAEKNGWTRHAFDIANNAASGDKKRRMTEVVWTNY